MNRQVYVHDYKKPSTTVYLAQVWCSWNAAQVREAGTRVMAIYLMRESAKNYGISRFGANIFDDWNLEDTGSGCMRIEGRAYYRS